MVAEDGKQFYDLISAQRHEDKLILAEIKNIKMYNEYGKNLEINDRNFREAYKIVIKDVNELPLFKQKLNLIKLLFLVKKAMVFGFMLIYLKLYDKIWWLGLILLCSFAFDERHFDTLIKKTNKGWSLF